MAWIILIVAGLFEIAWVVGLKFAVGFTRFWPSIGSAIALLISIGLLGWAVRTLPLGTAYAVWTGIGAVGTVILGIALFEEPTTIARILCTALIIAGIVGLKATS